MKFLNYGSFVVVVMQIKKQNPTMTLGEGFFLKKIYKLVFEYYFFFVKEDNLIDLN